MMTRDFRAILSYETKTQLDRTGTELIADGKRIPGWYIRVYYGEGYNDIYKYTRLTGAQAEALAEAFDTATTLNHPSGQPAREYVRRLNSELEAEQRSRLERIPDLIQDLEAERDRLRRDLA